MARAPTYEVWRGAGVAWYWHLRAANGEIVAAGEGYKRRAGALRGVEAHRRCAATAVVVVLPR